MSEMSENGVDPQLMELRTAALRRACELLTKLEAMIKRSGGYASQEDQEAVREAREFLASMGYRIDPNPPKTWTDRL
jgi:hypothetical protein